MSACHLLLYFFICSLTVVVAGPCFSQSGVNKGNELYEQKKYDEALEQYNKALEDEPGSSEIHFNLGNTG